MPVHNSLDLLGVNFQSADIDDAAPAPDKVVTVAALLYNVAGVDKAVIVGEGLPVPR